MRFGQGSGSETKGRHSRWPRDHDHHYMIVMINQIMGGGTQGDLKMINIGNISNIIIGTILIIIQDHIALKWQKTQGAGIGM